MWKATSRPPAASSRTAATDDGDAPAALPSRVPARPPAPHKTPARERQSRGVTELLRASTAEPAMTDELLRQERERVAEAGRAEPADSASRQCKSRRTPNSARPPARQPAARRPRTPRSGARWRGDREKPVPIRDVIRTVGTDRALAEVRPGRMG